MGKREPEKGMERTPAYRTKGTLSGKEFLQNLWEEIKKKEKYVYAHRR